MRNAGAPNLQDVLGAIVPGRVVRLTPLTSEQQKALRDHDAQIGLNVVRHLLGARKLTGNDGAGDRFPLTEATFQAIARKLGHTIGIKRSRSIIRRLIAAKVIDPSGSYRQQYRRREGSTGYRVALYRLAVAVRRVTAPLRSKRPVGRGGAVKGDERSRWWQVGLFADAAGLPPPGHSEGQLRRMRSADERSRSWR